MVANIESNVANMSHAWRTTVIAELMNSTLAACRGGDV